MQPRRDAQPHRHPADEQQRVDQGQRVAGHLGRDLARQPPRQNPLEAGTEIALSGQRPQLFHGLEPLAQPPEEGSARRPAAGEARHAPGTDAVHHHRTHHRERRHRDPDAPVLKQQHHHDAARHQQVGGQLRQQVRRQTAQPGNVAVDALQEGARSGPREERMPEIDGMAKQHAPQAVHRLPGQHGAGVGTHDLQPRAGQGDPDEQRRHAHQPLDRGTGLRQIEERPHHQRASHLQARPGHQRGDHHRDPPAPPPRVATDEGYIPRKAGAGGPSHAPTNGVARFTRSTCVSKSLMQLPQSCPVGLPMQTLRAVHEREPLGPRVFRRQPDRQTLGIYGKAVLGNLSEVRWPVASRTKMVRRNGRNRLQLKILGVLRDSCFLFGFPPCSLVLALASATAACNELPHARICTQEYRVFDTRRNSAIWDNENLKRHPVAIAEISHFH